MLPVLTYYHVQGQNEAFKAVKGALQPHLVPSFEKWSTAHLDTHVRSVNSFSRTEVYHLLALIPSILPETYFEVLVSLLRKCMNQANAA